MDREHRWQEKLTEERVSAERAKKDAQLAKTRLQAAEEDARGVRKTLLTTAQANKDLEELNKRQAEEITQLRGMIARRDEALALRQKEIKTLEKANKKLSQCERELSEMRQTMKEQDNELRELRVALNDSRIMLDIRAGELLAARAYLYKADPVSHADILAMLQRLNSQIYQLSASISDAVSFDDLPVLAHTLQEQYERAQRSVGGGMTRLLTSLRHKENLAYVKMALQSAMSHFILRFLGIWNISINVGCHHMLESTYQRMMSSGKHICSQFGLYASSVLLCRSDSRMREMESLDSTSLGRGPYRESGCGFTG